MLKRTQADATFALKCALLFLAFSVFGLGLNAEALAVQSTAISGDGSSCEAHHGKAHGAIRPRHQGC